MLLRSPAKAEGNGLLADSKTGALWPHRDTGSSSRRQFFLSHSPIASVTFMNHL